LEKAKKYDFPVLLHVVTTKGKGYEPASENPTSFHSSAPFDVRNGKFIKSGNKPSYSKMFGQTVLELVRESRADGSTVFFSSHILPEVQVVCDRVGIIREGKLVAVERVEDLISQQFKRLRISFRTMPPEEAFRLPGVEELGRDDYGVTLEVRENLEQLMEKAVAFGIQDIETYSVSLEEIFLAYYGANKGGAHA